MVWIVWICLTLNLVCNHWPWISRLNLRIAMSFDWVVWSAWIHLILTLLPVTLSLNFTESELDFGWIWPCPWPWIYKVKPYLVYQMKQNFLWVDCMIYFMFDLWHCNLDLDIAYDFAHNFDPEFSRSNLKWHQFGLPGMTLETFIPVVDLLIWFNNGL